MKVKVFTQIHDKWNEGELQDWLDQNSSKVTIEHICQTEAVAVDPRGEIVHFTTITIFFQ